MERYLQSEQTEDDEREYPEMLLLIQLAEYQRLVGGSLTELNKDSPEWMEFALNYDIIKRSTANKPAEQVKR